MNESNVETVRLLFERFDASGVESALELISEDFVAVVPPALSAEPDVYEGHDGVRRYFAGFDQMLDEVHWEPLEIVEEGDAVIAWVRFRGRGSTSGIDVEQHAAVLLRVVDGKVIQMDPHPDMDAARRALRS
jgi:ketosteroid isomerase-like protein